MHPTEHARVPEQELEQAFAGTNFGTADRRGMIREALIQISAGFAAGHTITEICKRVGLVGPTGRTVNLKGTRFLAMSFGLNDPDASPASVALTNPLAWLQEHSLDLRCINAQPAARAHLREFVVVQHVDAVQSQNTIGWGKTPGAAVEMAAQTLALAQQPRPAAAAPPEPAPGM